MKTVTFTYAELLRLLGEYATITIPRHDKHSGALTLIGGPNGIIDVVTPGLNQRIRLAACKGQSILCKGGRIALIEEPSNSGKCSRVTSIASEWEQVSHTFSYGDMKVKVIPKGFCERVRLEDLLPATIEISQEETDSVDLPVVGKIRDSTTGSWELTCSVKDDVPVYLAKSELKIDETSSLEEQIEVLIIALMEEKYFQRISS